MRTTSLIYTLLLLALCTQLRAQDTIEQHLSGFESDSLRFNWLGFELNKAVYSDQEYAELLAIKYNDIVFASSNPNKVRQAEAYNYSGIAKYAKGSYKEAVDLYLKALEQLEGYKEQKLRSIIFSNLASCYSFRKENAKSIEYYLKAMDIAQELKDTASMALISNNLGIQYVEDVQYNEADKRYSEAIKFYQAINQPLFVGITLLSRGNLLIEQKEYNNAINDYNRAMELVPENVVPLLHAASIAGIGSAYNRMGQLKKGEEHLLISLEKATVINHLEQLKESHRELAELYEKKGDYKNAYSHRGEFMNAKDSLFTIEQDEVLIDALSKYESEQREQEIALLNSESKIADLKLDSARKRSIGLTIGLVIFGSLLFGLLSLFRKTRSQNTIISKALSEKEILLQEIHHRVKNNLQFISSLLGLQSEHIEDKKALSALQEGQDRVQSMALIHQNLYQENNLTGVDMKDYFIKLIRSLFDSYNIRKDQISLQLDIEDLNLDVDSVIPIGLIVNELVSNCLKYAFPDKRKGIITVSLQESDEGLEVIVADDGIGMPQDLQADLGSSFGYRLVNVFKDQLKADLSIENNNGTKVKMTLQIYHKV